MTCGGRAFHVSGEPTRSRFWLAGGVSVPLLQRIVRVTPTASAVQRSTQARALVSIVVSSKTLSF